MNYAAISVLLRQELLHVLVISLEPFTVVFIRLVLNDNC